MGTNVKNNAPLGHYVVGDATGKFLDCIEHLDSLQEELRTACQLVYGEPASEEGTYSADMMKKYENIFGSLRNMLVDDVAECVRCSVDTSGVLSQEVVFL
ncbi:hypothetical protein [Prevotella denticola]|uniref:hypothetical protein n=1 Tax=Prevotella denticola TaxID=28129 RepID=UPI001C5CD395|nr:hypothetical protein [Prevotella denticola]MBW4715166.1 hypothetical protein [Prevotella denticola]MBW4752944.1 hypothetical protein [Prevotella denticola]